MQKALGQRIDPRSDSYSALMWDVITNAHRFVPHAGMQVLDLGAHFGMFSLYCAARGAYVVAYEPSPHAFGELIHSSAVAHDIKAGEIEPINAAVWSSTGYKEFLLSKTTSAQDSFLEREDSGLIVTVPTISLRDALRGHPWECVKVDIEGAEYETFMAATKDDFRLIRFLTMEIHNDLLPKEHVQKLLEHLEKFMWMNKIYVKKNGVDTDVVATILCWW